MASFDMENNRFEGVDDGTIFSSEPMKLIVNGNIMEPSNVTAGGFEFKIPSATNNPAFSFESLTSAIEKMRASFSELNINLAPNPESRKDTDMPTTTTQFISIERARECIHRMVNVHNPDDLDEVLYQGHVAQVGQTFVKVAHLNDDGVPEVNVVMPERLSWAQLLPNSIRKGIVNNEDYSGTSPDGTEWSYEGHNRTFTLEVRHDEYTKAYWQTHFVVSADDDNYGPGEHLNWVHAAHENANIHVVSEIEELKGWANP